MKDNTSLHKKVIEHIECLTTTDPLKEMSRIESDTSDIDELAAKWLALAVLHGVNHRAKQIVISQEDDSVKVTAEYRESDLPSPGDKIGENIINAIKQITHAEKDKEKSLLSVGIGNDNITLKVKIKTEGGKSKVKIKFPEIE